MVETNHRQSIPGDLELQAKSVTVEHDIAFVLLSRGGPPIEYPLRYHPRLMNATYEQRKNVEIINNERSINWPDIGLTLSVTAMYRAASH